MNAAAGHTPVLSASPTASPMRAASPSLAPIATNTKWAEVERALVAQFGEAEGGRPRSLTTVGPLIGSELIRPSIILIAVGELFILAYLWVRFGFRFGTAAIIALLHDVVVVIGIFAILGYFFGLEFDALFVTALLTIIGFSVHDTIVVFDRIRENRIRHAGEPFGVIVNHSILQTLGRSINTIADRGRDPARALAVGTESRSGPSPWPCSSGRVSGPIRRSSTRARSSSRGRSGPPVGRRRRTGTR